MGALIRACDWSATTLGAPESWPHPLKTALSILLNSKHQMFLAWGPDLLSFYNDAYRPVLGARHPKALGKPFPEIWADIWPTIAPLVDRALAGEGTWSEDLPLVTFRNGFQEIAYFTFSYSPIFDDNGKVAGMFCACTETTDEVLSAFRARHNGGAADERRLHSLFQQAPSFMAVVRGPHHIFDMANSAHQRLVGFRNIIGKPVRDALPEIADQGFARLLDQVYATGQPHIGRGTPLLVQPASGAPAALRYIDFIFQPIPAPDGSVSGIFIQGHDVTDHKRIEAALSESEEWLRLALQAGRMIAWEQDLTTNFVTRSQNALDLLGIGSGPLSEMLDRIPPEDRPLREHFRPGGDGTGTGTIEFRYTTPGGRTLWLGMRGEWSGPNRLIGVTFDITDRKEAEAEIWRVANHDVLTGLPNRALFHQRFEEALHAAKQSNTSVSLLLIDFDHFKEINDALGHDAGDAFLRETARRLSTLVRDCDVVARFSGDEFAVLLIEPLRLKHAAKLAEAMIEKLSEPFQYCGRLIGSKASIGVAAFPDHDVMPADLLKDADIALFEAKAQGRSRVVIYRPALRSAIEQRIALLEDVRDALSKHRIVPFYQPKVCLSTGRVVGLEILARWRHPTKGILAPGYFGAAFDDPRLAIVLSETLLTKAAADMRGWLDAGLDPGRVAFNLSSCEFSQLGMPDHVFRILESAGIPPEHFEIEVTETVLLTRSPDSISATLNRFHDRGISIALDDFGTGYASLTHLKQFPVEHIKIDRSFVIDLEKDSEDEAIVAAIITLGRNLGMHITAEGVETKGQAERLRDLGCHNGQGYLFSRPVAGTEVPQLLARSGTMNGH
ncbi:sensor domain-containing protein [Microvirga makkahensis]|uniref:EAL domain-containing protein n=1 Tax=Microvirga makkahensis TaxID=1128670 RepID=A0A7X3MP25_9HYPH|nr:EAL domain-containing protein [Microvirga makkahensis]MXQ10589.1 EAL domain-containing protein [Microvirga makkahensis]